MSVKHPYLKQLKAYVLRFCDQSGPIQDENSSVLPFFKTLEDIVNDGLKPTNTFLSGLSARHFWHWTSVLPKHVIYSNVVASLNCAIDQTSKCAKITTDRGRGRLLLRTTINSGILAGIFRVFKDCHNLVVEFYDSRSIIGDEILCEILISLLEPLSQCTFSLNLRNCGFLDETWELGTFRKYELVPCGTLGIALENVNGRLIVVEVDSNSVADEHARIEAGDVIDELFGQSMHNASRRKFTSLLSDYVGSPTYISVIKCIGPDGFIYSPIGSLLQEAGLCKKAILANHLRRQKDRDVSSEFPPSVVNEKGQYLVNFCGYMDVGSVGTVERIEDGVTGVLEKAERRDVIVDLGETEVTVTCRSSSNILLRHSYPEIASCGRLVTFPLNFAYIAGDTTCTLAKKFFCYVFEAADDIQAKAMLQSIAQGFNRTHWAV